PGRVGFRGPVGGRRYLVIHHDNGLRSTYGPMQRIDVVRGAAIEAGDPVGTAGAGFHLTARRGDAYLDPSPFLNGACGRPRLVPVGARPGGVGAGGRGR
ncbi:MAG: M23 family metallopeptidase, partial [Actinomycetota bacterium]